MGLHDRLSKQNGNGSHRRDRRASGRVGRPRAIHAAATAPPRAPSDPYAELKSGIHHAVIAKLGPELFKRETGEDLSERVMHAVTEQLALDRTPLTREERRRLAARSPTTFSATARSSRCSATTRSPRSWSTATTGSSSSGRARSSGPTLVRRQRPPAADHRQDRLAGRPPHRRGLADGRRAPARRQPRQRDHPAAGAGAGRR